MHPLPLQVNEYLQSQGKEIHKTAVIQSNPEQSKHLETARMKVNDMWIDFVNLRSETYAEGSRIPTMEFGTPEQDALRRCGGCVSSSVMRSHVMLVSNNCTWVVCCLNCAGATSWHSWFCVLIIVHVKRSFPSVEHLPTGHSRNAPYKH